MCYKIVELVGSSEKSFDDAVKDAVTTAAKTIRNLRIATVEQFDVRLNDDGTIKSYRARVKISFKIEH